MTDNETEQHPSANGRPRWTDVLHQQERTEARLIVEISKLQAAIQKDIADTRRDVFDNKEQIRELRESVNKLEQSERIRERRSTDITRLVGGVRGGIVAAAALAALVISIANIVSGSW